VERAVVAGGGAYEPVLHDVLRRHLSVEVEVAEPLRGFDLGRADDGSGNGGADLALAVGLSLKGWSGSVPDEAPARGREPVLEGEPQ